MIVEDSGSSCILYGLAAICTGRSLAASWASVAIEGVERSYETVVGYLDSFS